MRARRTLANHLRRRRSDPVGEGAVVGSAAIEDRSMRFECGRPTIRFCGSQPRLGVGEVREVERVSPACLAKCQVKTLEIISNRSFASRAAELPTPRRGALTLQFAQLGKTLYFPLYICLQLLLLKNNNKKDREV
jgi:hypothetical protein